VKFLRHVPGFPTGKTGLDPVNTKQPLSC
jgi:hypothetical protein